MNDDGPLLSGSALAKRYGKTAVVHDVDLTISGGELVVLLGPNGSGKTTLMSMLVGLVDPDQGTVTRRDERCGWAPQGAATYPRLTVQENLELFAGLMHLPGDKSTLALAAAKQAGLEQWYKHRASQLSGGVRQRLNIAIGLFGDPSVLVLDEPTTGVDLFHRQALWSLLRDRANAGTGVLYSTHSLEDARIADRVCMIANGVVAFDGVLSDIAEHDPGSQAFPNLDDPVARGMLHLWGSDTA